MHACMHAHCAHDIHTQLSYGAYVLLQNAERADTIRVTVNAFMYMNIVTHAHTDPNIVGKWRGPAEAKRVR